MVKDLPAMQETEVQSLGWEDPLEKEMAIHSSILAWRIPRTGAWQAMVHGLQRVGHDWATKIHNITTPNSLFNLNLFLFSSCCWVVLQSQGPKSLPNWLCLSFLSTVLLSCSLLILLPEISPGWRTLSWKGALAGQLWEFMGLRPLSSTGPSTVPLHSPTNGLGASHFPGASACWLFWNFLVISLSSPHYFPLLPSTKLLTSCRSSSRDGLL